MYFGPGFVNLGMQTIVNYLKIQRTITAYMFNL